MLQFNELGLSDQALEAVARLGYEAPTPVQEQAIPLALEGRDLIAAAKTGTGKTAAFSLPSLDRLEHAKGGQGPLMLVVTPTRELAQQIGEVCTAIATSTHHRILTVVGGLSYEPQIKKL
ncbi:MAG: DEAD/DEAH box helicase, partial [Paraeggerthella sp.]|nr:DEAD/DEAH box helicase [Paraeggerthella sp.]